MTKCNKWSTVLVPCLSGLLVKLRGKKARIWSLRPRFESLWPRFGSLRLESGSQRPESACQSHRPWSGSLRPGCLSQKSKYGYQNQNSRSKWPESWTSGQKLGFLGRLSHFALIWTILLELGLFSLDLGHIDRIWAILFEFLP